MQQLTNHEQDVARLQEDIAAQSSQCEETHEDSSVHTTLPRRQPQPCKWRGTDQQSAVTAAAADGRRQLSRRARASRSHCRARAGTLEDTSAALKSLEDSDSSCKAQLEALKGAHKTGQQPVLEDRKRMS